jgi:GT2 family glycosyltransferase
VIQAAVQRVEIAVVILNYRTPELALDCLASLEGELGSVSAAAIVVDNASGDGSADRLDRELRARGWRWARVVRSATNAGFSAGNNRGIASIDADAYLLLNSDTLVRAGAIAALHAELARNPDVGLAGPRLEWPDGTPQVSSFRQATPFTELLRAARTGPLDRLLSRHVTAKPIPEHPEDTDWVSFAAVMIRREAIEGVGPLDEGFFMYFEDADYCRRARRAGWRVRFCPDARVVHLRGGSSRVKSLSAARRRLPAYYYASRARYYAKYYARSGLWLGNALWAAGRLISLAREIVEGRPSHACEREGRDIWTHWKDPLRLTPSAVHETARPGSPLER